MLSAEELSNINKKIIITEIVFFVLLGSFGNVNLIWSTLRKKDMRTKSGILLSITAFCHIFCLLSELINLAFIVRGKPIFRSECFQFLVPYIFVICTQAILSLTLALDILIAILMPVKYMKWQIAPYILIACTPAVLYSAFIVYCMIMYQNNDEIPYCNPPMVLVPSIARVWSMSNVIVNSTTVAIYIIIIAIVKYRGQSGVGREQHRVIRRLLVVALVFVFSWYLALLGVDIGSFFPDPIRSIWQSNMIFFALLCYSQTFYVCLWRSIEYRHLFFEQMNFFGIGCCQVTSVDPSFISKSHGEMHTHHH